MNIKQKLKIYFVSFFLTPFGLYWFFKYFKHEDPAYKKEGYMALFLTLFALGLSYFIVAKYMQVYSGYLDLYKDNMDVYRQMGY